MGSAMTHERLLDLRHEQTDRNRRDACEYRRGAVYMRDPKAVTAIAIHQTAAWFSTAAYQVAASKGDHVLARHRRFLAVNAHVTAGRHGKFVVAHDPLAYVNHGHQLNAFTVGLEHEGHYTIDGDPIDAPGSVDVGEVIEADALRCRGSSSSARTSPMSTRTGRRCGHRRARRRATPARGSLEVGVQHGVRKLGLKIEPERTWGSGHPLPANWYGPRA